MKLITSIFFILFISNNVVFGQGLTLNVVEVPLSETTIVNLEIGDFSVPENRIKAHTSLIKLKVARLKAKNKKTSIPIIYLAGGPGGSAINDLRVPSVQNLLLNLNEEHDIILIDQRGTGNSSPKLVWEPTKKFREQNQSLIQDMFLDNSTMKRFVEKVSVSAKSYFENQHIDLMGYNTIESVHDIKAVCDALGVKTIHLIGFSYGTHLALATIKTYPSLIESAVCVGTEGLNNTYKLPYAYDKQLKQLSKLAAKSSTDYSGYNEMDAVLKRLLNQLEISPINLKIENSWTKTIDDIKFGKFGLQLILRYDLGDSNDFIWFPKMLCQMELGNYELLKKYVTKRYNQFQGGAHGMATMMNLSSGATKARRRKILKQAKTSLFGNVMNFPEMEIEDVWGAPDLGNEYRKSVKSSIKVLFISGSLDSNAPVVQTMKIGEKFKRGHHVIVENAGHESMLPNPQVQQIIKNFISGKGTYENYVSSKPISFKSIH